MSDPFDRRGGRPEMPEIVGRVFGLAFGGIGVTVLVFLWGTPFNEFHSPPLFFRVFGTFVALPFIAFGATALFGKFTPHIRAGEMLRELQRKQSAWTPGAGNETADSPGKPVNYQCPNCAASIAAGANVSPHGDCLCPHCAKWFNIHRA